jgi:hypothetical protein
VLAASPAEGATRVEIHVIPTDYRESRFTARVQVVVPPTHERNATWVVEAAVLSGAGTGADASTMVRETERLRPERYTSLHLTVPEAGTPGVVEIDTDFRPGPFDVAVLARRSAAGETLEERLSGTWDDPDVGPALIVPITVLQQSRGAIARLAAGASDAVVRSQAAVGRARHEPLRAELPSALVGLVCRGSRHAGMLKVKRRLLGQQETNFEDMEMDLRTDQCAVLQDLVPAGEFPAGLFLYQVQVLDAHQELARGARLFAVVRPAP